MDKKLNYMILITIIIGVGLLIIVKYLNIVNDNNIFTEYKKELAANTKQEYKNRLKDSVDLTNNFITHTYKNLKIEHEKILEIELSNLLKKLKKLYPENKIEFINKYKHKLIVISENRLKNKIEKEFVVNGNSFFISVKEDVLMNLLSLKTKEFIYSYSTIDNRYIWINKIINFNGGEKYAIRLIHPNLKSTEGVFLSTTLKDIKGNTPYLEELNGVKRKGDVYFEYYFKDLNSSQISKKLTYAKINKEFNWIIATGIPLTNLNTDIQQRKENIQSKFEKYSIKMYMIEFTVGVIFLILFIKLRMVLILYINKNKELQEKLKKSLKKTQSNFKDLFYKNKSIILITDPFSGKILEANLAALNFYNYTDEVIKTMYIHDINTYTPKEISEEINLAKTENREHLIFKHKVSNGKVIPVKVFSTPTYYNNEIVLYSIIQDIHEEFDVKKDLNQTIGELNKIKINLDLAQKISHMGSWEYDIKRKIFLFSDELLSIFEINREEMQPTRNDLLCKVHPNDLELVERGFKNHIKENKKFSMKFRLLFDDGRVKYLEECTDSILEDNGYHIKIIGTIHDITEVTLLENKISNFFNLSLNLHLVADFNGTILQANSGWEQILGYKEEELINKKIFDFIHPEDLKKTVQEFNKLKIGKKIYYFENRYKHKNGLYRIFSWSANGISEDNAIYASAQDITENKEKTIMLYQQSKMASMGEMIGNIAHQWRQPLSIISVASSGLKLQHEMKILSDERFTECVDGITKATKQLSSTIDDFRDFFKPNKEKTMCTTTDIIKKTLFMIESLFKNLEIEIVKDIKEIEFLVYKNELIQVLINLFNNAKDQLIKENIEKKIILITIVKENDKLILIIKDNGKGIEENIIDKVFEPYFTTKDKSRGTGIGLFMCEEIITKHLKGELYVRNNNFIFDEKQYTGAEFSIILDIKGA